MRGDQAVGGDKERLGQIESGPISGTFAGSCWNEIGGWGGIRTHEGLAPLPVFKTGAFNRSATYPIRYPLLAMQSKIIASPDDPDNAPV